MSRKDVGYGKPPAEHRFPKGKSGNPAGRPRKPKPELASLLDEPVKVIRKGQQVAMQPFEASLQQHFRKAVKDKQVSSIIYVIELLIKHGALPMTKQHTGGSVHLPSTMPFRMASMASEQVGDPGSWTKARLKKVRDEYLATRCNYEKHMDEAMEYEWL